MIKTDKKKKFKQKQKFPISLVEKGKTDQEIHQKLTQRFGSSLSAPELQKLRAVLKNLYKNHPEYTLNKKQKPWFT